MFNKCHFKNFSRLKFTKSKILNIYCKIVKLKYLDILDFSAESAKMKMVFEKCRWRFIVLTPNYVVIFWNLITRKTFRHIFLPNHSECNIITENVTSLNYFGTTIIVCLNLFTMYLHVSNL